MPNFVPWFLVNPTRKVAVHELFDRSQSLDKMCQYSSIHSGSLDVEMTCFPSTHVRLNLIFFSSSSISSKLKITYRLSALEDKEF